MAADLAWRCARCGTAENRNRRSFCCRACGAWLEARGLMWCGTCAQPRPLLHGKSRGRCRACRSADEYGRKRGWAPRQVTRRRAPVATNPITHQIVRAWALLAADEWNGSLE